MAMGDDDASPALEDDVSELRAGTAVGAGDWGEPLRPELAGLNLGAGRAWAEGDMWNSGPAYDFSFSFCPSLARSR